MNCIIEQIYRRDDPRNRLYFGVPRADDGQAVKNQKIVKS